MRLTLMRKRLDCCLLALAQLNRGMEGQEREPHMGDLRDSGAIEQDAHVVALLHRPEAVGDDTPALLLVKKHRGGRRGVVNLSFNGPRTMFSCAGEGL